MNQNASPISVADLDFTPAGKVQPSPRDWRDQFIYHLMVDRFDDNGDHPPYHPNEAKHGRDPEQACKFQGGNLKGITRRLDYIQNLGCTTIWVSPPFKNRQECCDTFHGYGIQNFLQIDPRFGTLEDLQELVHQAHQRGMYVILDIVINHTGNNWGYPDDAPLPYHETGSYDFGFWRCCDGSRISHEEFKNRTPHPDDAVWPIELQDPSCYKRRGRIRDFRLASEDEKLNADFEALKELDLQNPKVLDTLIKCYKYWIAVADIDGFRMDTVGHTEPEQTAIFVNAIREYAKSIGKDNFIVYAEIVADDEKLKKFVGANTPEDDAQRYPIFDACLDFPLYFVLEEVLKGKSSPATLRDRYENFRRFYRDYGQAGQYFVTFVDNHDQMHRPFRRVMHGETDPKLGVLAISYLLTNMGIPCIYYGTEQGFDGAGPTDNWVRECMFGGQWGAFDTTGSHFFNPNHPIYQGIAKIAQIRAQEKALRYGREYFREISGNGVDFGHPVDGHCTLAFSRVLDTTSIVVAMNLDTQARQDYVLVDPKLNSPGSELVDLIEGKTYHVHESPGGNASVRIPLQSRQMVILKKQ